MCVIMIVYYSLIDRVLLDKEEHLVILEKLVWR